MSDYSVSFDGISTGTARKTVLEIAIPSTIDATLYHWWIDFHGTAADMPVLVEVIKASASMTGTTTTPERLNGNGPTPGPVTAKRNESGDASASRVGTAIWKKRVSPTTGYELFLPSDHLLELDPSTWLRLDVTASVSVLCTPGFAWTA